MVVEQRLNDAWSSLAQYDQPLQQYSPQPVLGVLSPLFYKDSEQQDHRLFFDLNEISSSSSSSSNYSDAWDDDEWDTIPLLNNSGNDAMLKRKATNELVVTSFFTTMCDENQDENLFDQENQQQHTSMKRAKTSLTSDTDTNARSQSTATLPVQTQQSIEDKYAEGIQRFGQDMIKIGEKTGTLVRQFGKALKWKKICLNDHCFACVSERSEYCLSHIDTSPVFDSSGKPPKNIPCKEPIDTKTKNKLDDEYLAITPEQQNDKLKFGIQKFGEDNIRLNGKGNIARLFNTGFRTICLYNKCFVAAGIKGLICKKHFLKYNKVPKSYVENVTCSSFTWNREEFNEIKRQKCIEKGVNFVIGKDGWLRIFVKGKARRVCHASLSCTFAARGKGEHRCGKHGAPRPNCKQPGCSKVAQIGGFCCSHGGYSSLCKYTGCKKSQLKGGYCKTHGGIQRLCIIDGCKTPRMHKEYCSKHNPNKRICEILGCTKIARSGSKLCRKHGAKHTNPLCRTEGCGKCAVGGTPHCRSHGGGRRCVEVDVHSLEPFPPVAYSTFPHCYSCVLSLDHPEYVEFRNAKGRQLRKEHFIVAELDRRFPELASFFTQWDCAIAGGCSAYRPDVLYEFMKRWLIIECDENAHNQSYERLRRLYLDLDSQPGVVVRLNPDNKVFKMFCDRYNRAGTWIGFEASKHFKMVYDAMEEMLFRPEFWNYLHGYPVDLNQTTDAFKSLVMKKRPAGQENMLRSTKNDISFRSRCVYDLDGKTLMFKEILVNF